MKNPYSGTYGSITARRLGGECSMRDITKGVVEGLSIALYLAEKNRKNPKRIESEIQKVMRDLQIVVGFDGIDNTRFGAGRRTYENARTLFSFEG
jgi:hypothetical protein